MDMIGAGGADLVSGIISPFTSDELNPAFVDQVVKGKATLPAETVQQINAGEIKVPPTLAEALLSGRLVRVAWIWLSWKAFIKIKRLPM
jgi:hypothetical protein